MHIAFFFKDFPVFLHYIFAIFLWYSAAVTSKFPWCGMNKFYLILSYFILYATTDNVFHKKGTAVCNSHISGWIRTVKSQYTYVQGLTKITMCKMLYFFGFHREVIVTLTLDSWGILVSVSAGSEWKGSRHVCNYLDNTLLLLILVFPDLLSDLCCCLQWRDEAGLQ